jgi:hypothetical protein
MFFCHYRGFLFELTIQQAALTSKTQDTTKTTETKLLGKRTSVWFVPVFRQRHRHSRGSGFKQYLTTTDSIRLSVVVFLNYVVDNSTDMLRDKSQQHG